MKEKLSIKHWDENDRPREKLVSRGAHELTEAELLGVLIGSGTTERSAVQIGEDLLQSVEGNLSRLSRMSIPELQTFHGIGLARSVVIAAALELGRRRHSECPEPRQHIAGSADIAAIFQPLLADLPHEEVWVMLLTRSKRIIERYRLSQGGIEHSVVDPRLVVRRAMERNASGIVLVHNHPSGVATPSELDVTNTGKLKIAASYFDMKLLDHLIVTKIDSFSFAEHGLL